MPYQANGSPKTGFGGGRSTFNGRGRGSPRGRGGRPNFVPYHKPVIDTAGNWKEWAELRVRLDNLPKGVAIRDIFEVLGPFGGSIANIDIVNKPDSVIAFIRYSKVPDAAFWNQPYIASGLNNVRVRAQLLPQDLHSHRKDDEDGVKYEIAHLRTAADGLQFGIMLQEDEFAIMRELQAKASGPIAFLVDPDRREAVVEFNVLRSVLNEPTVATGSNIAQARVEYKIILSFKQLDYMWLREDGPKDMRLIIPCDMPAKVYRKISPVASTAEDGDLNWNVSKAWVRQTDIVYGTNGMQQLHQPLSIQKNDPFVDVGSWTTYCLQLPSEWKSSANARVLVDILGDHNIQILHYDHLALRTMEERTAPLWSILIDNGAAKLSRPLSWSLRYQLEACISQNVLSAWNIELDFLQALLDLDEKKALRILEHAVDKGQRIYKPMSIFEKRLPAGYGIKRVPAYCIEQRAISITPSSLHFSNPSVEVSNRIIRQWAQHGDRFLRVRFTDEKMEGKIFSTDDEVNDVLYNRVRRCLLHGINIGGRHYEFLASGNSQFREHGAYFFAPINGTDATAIRKKMGDFRSSTAPAKYAARMGQCFSTTRALKTSNVNIVEIDDVERNGHKFTDGVGMISPFLAQTIASEHGMNRIPSAIQFRLGGSKGVLSVWPGKAKDRTVYLRKSQYKFHCNHEGLEVIKAANFVCAQLNRQLITNLEALGIPAENFVSKMSRQLRGVDEAMYNPEEALDQLSRRIDPNFTTLALHDMVDHDFMQADEPFVMAILQLWRSWVHKSLKEKANIHIEKAAFVMGISDESGTLRGHSDSDPDNIPKIFLQTMNPRTGVCEVIRGTCIVMRNPSLHPGDVRVVRAVEKKSLMHLKNVVVFPQNGDRDVPGMCSGGDLDGDDFFVSWDSKLIPEEPERNHAPMEHHSLPPQHAENGIVTIPNIIDFFVTYMKQDSLGRIANAWQAMADIHRLDGGPKHPDCQLLAQEHSVAVDFLKTGSPPRGHILRQLGPKLRIYPHYMEHSKHKKFYKSRSACGKLFDLVERVEFRPSFEKPFDDRILQFYDDAKLPDELLKRVTKLKNGYDTAVRRIMNQFEIRTEFEIWSGFILAHSSSVHWYELQTKVGELYESVKNSFREEVFQLAGESHLRKLFPWICAMYVVTERERQVFVSKAAMANLEVKDLDVKEWPFISFPWIFYREMGKMTKHRAGQDDLDELQKELEEQLAAETDLGDHYHHHPEPEQTYAQDRSHTSDEDEEFVDASESPVETHSAAVSAPESPSADESAKEIGQALDQLAVKADKTGSEDDSDNESSFSESWNGEPKTSRFAALAALS